jgi:N-acetylmuramoyl-L-alanine amidase
MRRAILSALITALFAVIAAAADTTPPQVDAPASRIITVVIDPAHGGGDWGVVMGGTYEKTINLKIAKLVKKKFENEIPQIRVLLTRQGDEFLAAAERAGAANAEKADIYISIHCDFTLSGAPGFKVYYTAGGNPAPDEEPAEWEAVQDKFHAENARLARFLAQYMNEALIPEGEAVLKEETADLLPFSNRGTVGAKLFPVKGVNAPAAVVEIANMVSSEDLANIKNDKILSRVAYHIKEAIVNYIKSASFEKGGR